MTQNIEHSPIFCCFFSSKMSLQKCFAIFSHRKWVCKNVLLFFLIENRFAKMFCHFFSSKMGLQKCFAIFSHRKCVCKNVLPFFLIENGFAKMFYHFFSSKIALKKSEYFNLLKKVINSSKNILTAHTTVIFR